MDGFCANFANHSARRGWLSRHLSVRIAEIEIAERAADGDLCDGRRFTHCRALQSVEPLPLTVAM